MPRPVDRTRASRVSVNRTADVGRYSVVAPGPGIGAGGAGQTAANLASALGLGGDVYKAENERQVQSDTLAGERDFNLGAVDAELRERNRAYNKAVTQNEAEAGWIQDVDEFEQSIKEVDLESLDPAEQLDALNATIDELYARKYEGLDDPDQAEVLMPRMEKYRQAKLEELLTTQRTIADERINANLQTVVRGYTDSALEAAAVANPDLPEHELTASEGFDYLGLHGRVRALKPGAETNDTYFSILKDLAVRNGDPDLLRNLPEKWADGTPSFKAMPKWNDKLLAAEQQAENVRSAKAKAYDKALEDERKAQDEALASEGYNLALTGVDPTAWMLEQVRAGKVKGKTANSVVQAYRSAQQYDADLTADPTALVDLQTRVLLDPESVTVEELHQQWADGVFGDPRQAASAEALRTLLKDRESSKSAGKSIASNPRAKAKVDRFKMSYAPKADPLTGALVAPAAERAFYAEMVDKLNQKLASGEDSDKAFNEIEDEYLGRIAKIQALDEQGPSTTEESVVEFLSGNYSAADVVANLRAKRIQPAAARETFKSLHDTGSLTRDKYRDLLNELLK